ANTLDPGPVPLTHFPPLYPAALAAVARWGLGLRDAARWLNAALFSFNVALVGLTLLGRCRSSAIALAATLWMVLSVDLICLHVMVWSEPLSLAFGFACLIILSSSLEGRLARTVGVPVAAALAGMALATRYAGAAYALAGILALLVV